MRTLLMLGFLVCLLGCGGGDAGSSSGGGGPAGEVDPLPPLLCDAAPEVCGELVPFEPDVGEGYVDILLAGETIDDERYDHVRHDVMLALQHAAARVARVAADWSPGHGAPLGIGYMSESDGGTPRNAIGELLFPAGTHVGGTDVTVAYYQVGTVDNTFRTVCPHDNDGQEAYRCTAAPDALDARRTALFVATLAEHPLLRVIGVDPLVGPVLEQALDDLVAEGVVDASARASIPLAYSPASGFEMFHHLLMHVGFN